MVKTPVIRLGRRIVYRTRWLQVEEHRLTLRASGRQIRYSFIRAAPSVSIVAVTPAKKILVLRQYRYPTGGYNYELPGAARAVFLRQRPPGRSSKRRPGAAPGASASWETTSFTRASRVRFVTFSWQPRSVPVARASRKPNT